MNKFIEDIIEEHYPAKKAPKWVNYKLFKAEMIKTLKENLEDSLKYNSEVLDISSILFGYISENMDEGSSVMKDAYHDESYVPIPKGLKLEEQDVKPEEEKDYASLKVVELRELLKKKGLATTGKKVDLIKRLKDNSKKPKETSKKSTKPEAKPKKTTKKSTKTKKTIKKTKPKAKSKTNKKMNDEFAVWEIPETQNVRPVIATYDLKGLKKFAKEQGIQNLDKEVSDYVHGHGKWEEESEDSEMARRKVEKIELKPKHYVNFLGLELDGYKISEIEK